MLGYSDEEIAQRIRVFLDPGLGDDEVKSRLGLKENYAWRVSTARAALLSVKDWEDEFTDILYRPFDWRRILFDEAVVWRTRGQTMRQMLGEPTSRW